LPRETGNGNYEALKLLKEEAIRDKEDMERKFIQLQDEVRKAQEELVCLSWN
jgi:hypothetical protein